MFTWLMPFILLSVTIGACPDPATVPCGAGTSCYSHREEGCCPNACGTLRTLINEIVHLSRITREAGDCPDSEEGSIGQDGCKLCVCKYNRRECIYKGCRACLVIGTKNSTVKYSHGDEFESGCLRCTCRDGELDCNHTECGSCDHRGNSTASGQKKAFGCGTCECFDGQWTCNEACGNSSAQGLSYLGFLSLVLLHLALHHIF